MLPLPTVSPIDTTEAALSDIERRRNMKAPDIAGAVTGAVNTGLAVNKAVQDQADAQVARTDAQKARDQAQWFQKNYVDQGWDGYAKAWQEAGAPPEADPRFVRKAVGDTPTAAFELLGKVTDKKKANDAATAYETALKDPATTPEQLSALAIAAGKSVSPEKGYEAIKDERALGERAQIAKDKAASSEKIAGLRAAATAASKAATKALSEAKDAGVIAAIEKETDRQADINAEIESVASDTTMTEGAKRRKVDQLTRDLSSSATRVSGYLTRVRDVSKADSVISAGGKGKASSGPKEGDTKTNSAGDNLVFRGGAWVLQ